MTMRAESLEILEKAEVPPAQARAIVRAIELELAGAKDTLATTYDVLELKAEIHASASGITRQLYLAVLGQMAGMLGFAYFFATNLR